MNKRGLGKGLQALLPVAEPTADEAVAEITVAEIRPNPFQPRTHFDAAKLEELATSIRQHGVLQPVVVRRVGDGYQLVAGERRWRACRMAGLATIPAVVREYSDGEMMEIALIENLQREDLNPIEEALAYIRLMEEFGLTQEAVAQKIGRSRSQIANTVRLLNLPPAVQDHVSRGTLTMGHAKPLLGIADPQEQIALAERIVAEGLSARDVEKIVQAKQDKKEGRSPKPVPKRELSIVEAEEYLKRLLGTQVRIKPGKIISKIEIEYYSTADLERILEVMTPPKPAQGQITKPTLVV